MRLVHAPGAEAEWGEWEDASFESAEMNGESGAEDYVEATFELSVSIRSKKLEPQMLSTNEQSINLCFTKIFPSPRLKKWHGDKFS